VSASSVGRALHELAEEIGADLIVLGSSPRGLLGRVLLGDDTRAALKRCLRIDRRRTNGLPGPRPGIQTIGVGHDGSPESEHALELARKLAAEQHAALAALTAVSIPTAVFGPGPLRVLEAIDALVSGAKDRIADLGGAQPRAADVAAAEELAAFSDSVDLLIIASRGYGPIGRLVHGSVARQLARTGRSPLLVLTRAGKPADQTYDGSERRAAIKAAHER
jgi:nucleotide-binding universal stress UspA family protein